MPLTSSEVVILILIFAFGLVWGSFLNSVIWRIFKGMSFSRGRSLCPSCQTRLRWFELIPLISFFLLRGKCRTCRQAISWQYPLVELATAIIFAGSYWLAARQCSFVNSVFNCSVSLVRYWFYLSVLIVIFVFDYRWQLIPDKVTLPAIGAILVVDLLVSQSVSSFWHFLFAALVGGGFFLVQFLLSRGQWIGGGDIRLGVLMGLMLGWPQVLVALFFSYISGALIGFLLIVIGRKNLRSRLPFGTFLTVATVVTLFWGELVIRWYLG